MPILFCVTPNADESNLNLSNSFCNPDDYDSSSSSGSNSDSDSCWPD